MPPDRDYPGPDGYAGRATSNRHADIRKLCALGHPHGRRRGVEYYFGYKLPQNDLICEDWRSRDRSWDYCRIAIEFFRDHDIPFWEMKNANALIGNDQDDNSHYCFARTGDLYLVFLPQGGTTQLDLRKVEGTFHIQWFDPRNGGSPVAGSLSTVRGGKTADLGNPPQDTGEDWLIVVRRD